MWHGYFLLSMYFDNGFKVSVVAMINSVWLCTVNYLSPPSSEMACIMDTIIKITIVNVPGFSPHFIATAATAYCVFGITLYLILKDF